MYLACWFFKFVSPDVKSMKRAIASHGFGHSTQTFTGYVVTTDEQPVKENIQRYMIVFHFVYNFVLIISFECKYSIIFLL